MAAFVAAGCGGASEEASPPPGQPTKAAPHRSKPHLAIPPGPPPGRLIEKNLVAGHGKEARHGAEVGIEYYRVDYYTGRIYDSSSWDEREPWRIKLGGGGVVLGFVRGVEGMKVGGRRELIIPPKLGFGAQRVGVIKPHSTLLFVVELVEVD